MPMAARPYDNGLRPGGQGLRAGAEGGTVRLRWTPPPQEGR